MFQFSNRISLLFLAILFASCAFNTTEVAKIAPPPAAAVEEVVVESKKSTFETAMEQAAVLSQDGGNPIIYPGGALVTFGETFLGRRMADEISVEFLGGVPNSLLKMERKNGVVQYEYLTDAKGAANQFLALKSTEASDRYKILPGGGIQSNGHFYVFYELIDKEAPKGSKTASKVGLARSNSSWKHWDRLALSDSFPFTVAPYSVVTGKDGIVYAYFVENHGDSSTVRVARVAQDKLESPAAYSMLEPVLARDVSGPVSVAWNDYLQSYIMCHVGHASSDPRSIYIRRSPSPTGPFSAPEQVLRLSKEPLGESIHGMIYCSYLYPEMFRDNGRLMTLSYGIRERHSKPNFFEFEVKK